jgi:asparagine synthase (glutamine-hydrolysing)
VTSVEFSRFDDVALFWRARLDPRAGPGEALTISMPQGAGPVEIARQGARVLLLEGDVYDRAPLEAVTGSGDHLTDGELVLSAYERIGREVIPLMRGEFALLIWDGGSGSFVAARDRLGACPLFYAETNGVSHFSPSPEVLSLAEEVPADLDQTAIAEWVVWGMSGLGAEETFYRAIRRLPPAHFLERHQGQLRISRYWHPREPEPRAHWDPTESFERFDALLRQAVSRCLGHGPVGVLLSGGIDSASVTAVATEESRAAGIPDPWALSLKFLHPGSDEEMAQKTIAADLGIPQVMLRFDEAAGPEGTITAGLRAGAQSWLPSFSLWRTNYYALISAGKERGCGAILNGEGGDHWFDVDWSDAVPMLSRLELSSLRRFLRIYQTYYPSPLAQRARHLLWRYGLRPIVADSACSILKFSPRSLRRMASARVEGALPTWALPDRRVRRAVVERGASRHPWVTASRPSRRGAVLGGPEVPVGLENQYLEARRFGVPLRAPYFDADLVEFLFRTPVDTQLYGNRFKGLAYASYRRRARGGSTYRPRPTSFVADAEELRAKEMPAALDRLGGVSLLAELGIVDRKEVELSLRGTCDPGRIGYYQAWQVLACEAWIRGRLEERQDLYGG